MTRPRRTGRLALAVVLAGSLVLAAGCSGEDEPEDDGDAATTTSVVPASPPEDTAPTGPPPGATEQGLRELVTGNCFELAEDPGAEDRAVWLIDCAQPHSHEVYDVVDYDAPGSGGGEPYPGVPVVQNWAEDACHSRFEGFVGTEWILSDLEIQVWWPSDESWDAGDRTVLCTVFSPAGDDLVGSQRNSGA